MRAAVIAAPGDIEVTTVDDPTPGPDEVIVEIAAVGLCGTDLHILAGEHGTLPVIPGHEMTGTIVGLGRDVTGFSAGDRVTIDPNLACRRCRQCRRGQTNLCVAMTTLGVTVAGGAADYMAAPVVSCVALPPSVDLQAATLIEPLSCAIHGYDLLTSRLAESVLIYGAGTMGLMMLQLAKRTGAVTVDVVDINPDKLARATNLGCTSALSSAAECGRAAGWDVVIDATGNAAAIQDGLGHIANGGTFLQFGVASPAARVSVSPYDIYRRELTVVGSMAVLNSFERAAELFAAGVIDPDIFITRRAPLEEYADALAAFGRGEGLKTQVVPGGVR